MTDVSTQTDEELLYNYAWQKFYYHFLQAATPAATLPTNANTESANTDAIVNEMSAISISNELVPVKNGIYFDSKTGLYYDSEKQLYFDLDGTKSKAWYHYTKIEQTGSYHLRYKQKLSKKDKKILSRKLERLKDETPKSEEDTDVIILDNDSDNEKKVDDNDSDIVDVTNKYPPCIRAILVESKNLKLGSLFLIPYTGGSIGRDSSRNLIDFAHEQEVETNHASIEYDLEQKKYFVEDKESTTGTFLNNIRLAPNQKFKIMHGDMLRIGRNKMLLHIHVGSTTCVRCEPGEVMAKLKRESELARAGRPQRQQDRESYRRDTNRELKKKHGIRWNNIDRQRGDDSTYIDKAKMRRDTVGVDLSHIREENDETKVASVDTCICESNKGFKLLKSMGWTEGRGLGKNGTGIIEPVNTEVRKTTSGLGFVETSESRKGKRINWTKTQGRYSQLKTAPLPKSKSVAEVFNVDTSEEEIKSG